MLVYEIIRLIITGFLFLYLFKKKNHFTKIKDGWNFIIIGFGLLFIGQLFDITDEFPALAKYYFIGPTPMQAFIEKIVGNTLGLVFVLIGFIKWIPKILKSISLEKEKTESEKLIVEIKQKVKEVTCLYKISELVQNGNTFEKVFDDIIKIIPSGWQYPKNICCRIVFDNFNFESDNFVETKWNLHAPLKLKGEIRGAVNIYYTEEKKEEFEGPFLEEERELINGISNLLGSMIQRAIMEDDLIIAREEAEEAMEIAETATLTKSQFLATMSHEIRTPMNAIIGLSNLALKTELNPKQFDYLRKIDRSAFSLLGIINDILDFSKIEAGKLDIENIDFDLDHVIETVSDLNSQKAQDKGLEFAIHIENDVPLYLIGDSLRIGQIITNFCSNAIKFTEKGEVVVKVVVEEMLSDNRLKLQISVRDTGIGLSDEQKGKMFQEFSQADSSTTRKFGGTGLGLAISKRLAELMGGTTWVESEKDKGSTFYFSSVCGIQKIQKWKQFKPSDDLVGLNVLVCDDNETSRIILSEAMTLFSFNVKTVSSAKEALEELERNDYKLLLLDWLMPEMNGIELARKIRKESRFNDLKIIMVTAFGKEDIAQESGRIGLEGFITKPFTFSKMFDTIMTVFKKEVRASTSRLEKGAKHLERLNTYAGTKILVAEDNEINQQIATELLESVGLSVDIAVDGFDVVEKIKNSGIPSKYELIFMDIQMPGMSGYEATEKIKELNDYKDIPIIAMTADAMSGVKEQCFKVGMVDFVTKPINPDEVFKVILKWIEPKHPQISDSQESLSEESPFEITDDKKEIVKPPEIEGLDSAEGIMRVGGNQKLFISLLGKFYKSNLSFEDDIKFAVEENDEELSVRLAHTLKGVAGNLGAKNLFAESKKLEAELKDNNGVNFEKLLHSTMKQLTIVLNSIKENILSVKKEEEKQTISKRDLAIKLEELKTMLENYDSEVVNKLNEMGIIEGFESELSELKTKIENYDFDVALEQLLKIKKSIN